MRRLFLTLAIVCVVSVTAFAGSGESLLYRVNGENYEGYYITPKKGAPLVLLLHDWDGVTEYEVKRAHMLADEGYAVFVADLFGAGVRPTRMEDKRQHTGALYTNREKMRDLMRGALKAAESQGANIHNAVAIGYCFGGSAVLELARSGADLKGFAVFHGGLTTPKGQGYTKTRAEVLVMHGAADQAISMADFSALTMEMEGAGIDHEMIAYGGAPHAFTVFGGDRYRQGADTKSWRRLLEFLHDTMN